MSAVPKGQDGFWQIIREIDAAGPWAVGDIDGRSNVDRATVRDYVRRLLAGGYIESAGKRPAPTPWSMPSRLFRLVRVQSDAPRLRRDGSPFEERQNARLWRTLKMLKTATAGEIAVSATIADDDVMKPEIVRRYLRELAGAGFVRRVGEGKRGQEVRWQIVRGGRKPPQIRRGHKVVDANTS